MIFASKDLIDESFYTGSVSTSSFHLSHVLTLEKLWHQKGWKPAFRILRELMEARLQHNAQAKEQAVLFSLHHFHDLHSQHNRKGQSSRLSLAACVIVSYAVLLCHSNASGFSFTSLKEKAAEYPCQLGFSETYLWPESLK